MLPEVRLSSEAVLADYQPADAMYGEKLQDFEQGGIAIGDPTQGLNVQTWELRVLGNDVRVRPYPNGAYTTLFAEVGIQEIGLSFDQNMNPTIAYKAGNLCKLRWYDPTPGKQKFVTTGLPGVRDIKICLDDKRSARRDFSDILVFYLRDDPSVQPQKLYMRAQRDRYGIEYPVGNLPQGVTALHKVGMAINQRIRISAWGVFVEYGQPRRDVPPFPPELAAGALVLDFRKSRYPYYSNFGYALFNFSFELYAPPVSETLP